MRDEKSKRSVDSSNTKTKYILGGDKTNPPKYLLCNNSFIIAVYLYYCIIFHTLVVVFV